MATFTYPTSQELKEVEQTLLPVLTADDPIFDEFPPVEVNSTRLRWEQLDNYQGLQQVRGINGAPGKVNRVGAKAYDMEPGVYGEFTTVDEKELTERRTLGSYDTPIGINDLVAQCQQQLLTRRYGRMKHVLWTLLTTGTFSVAKADGTVLHSDTFPLQTYSGSAWATPGSGTPILDIRAVQLKYRGLSVNFGRKAKLYANQKTINDIMLNTNTSDFGRVRGDYGSTLNNLEQFNAMLASNDLPQLVPYDGGYLSDGTDGNSAGSFQLYIPDNKSVLVGARTNGAKLGEFRMTRNAENPNVSPGPYTRVIDQGEYRVPRVIEVHDGMNGGPVIYFPGAVVVITTT